MARHKYFIESIKTTLLLLPLGERSSGNSLDYAEIDLAGQAREQLHHGPYLPSAYSLSIYVIIFRQRCTRDGDRKRRSRLHDCYKNPALAMASCRRKERRFERAA